MWLPARTRFSDPREVGWLVNQREKEKERDILIEKKAKDLT